MKPLLLAAVLLCHAPVHRAAAQESPQSPVFKSYRPPRPGALVEQSDVTYRMWQTFQLTQQANAGDALAQHELGIRYLMGKGVPADTLRGAYWTERAAARRVIPAQFNLGILHLNGWGVAWDPFGAFFLFERAARAGMKEAQYILATIYLDNLIVARDPGTAFRWASAAADSGYQPARALCDELRPTAGGIPPGPSAAPRDESPDSGAVGPSWSPVFLAFDADTGARETEETFLKRVLRSDQPAVQGLFEGLDRLGEADSGRVAGLHRAADAGSPEALMALAWRELGDAAGDPVRAAEYLVRGVRQEAPAAGEILWDHLQRGDAAAAVVRAVRQRDPRASYVVSMLQAIGMHLPLLGSYAWLPDEDALGLLRSAALAGFRPAARELGICLYTGRWVRRDVGAALQLWERLAGEGDVEALMRHTAALVQEGRGDRALHMARLESGIRDGSLLAQLAAGVLLERGAGGKPDIGSAARLYRDAASRGSQDALRALRRLHDERRPAGQRFALPSG